MDNENETPYQPQRPTFRDRRATPKELRQTITRLKRQLRKEERRAEKVRTLKKYISELAAQINGYRLDPELR